MWQIITSNSLSVTLLKKNVTDIISPKNWPMILSLKVFMHNNYVGVGGGHDYF